MKKVLVGVLAFILTMATAYYQRVTGPTYPDNIKFDYNGKTVALSLPRTHETTGDCPVHIPLTNPNWKVTMFYKLYPVGETYTSVDFTTDSNSFVTTLPVQPEAGKVMYYVQISENGKVIFSNEDKPNIVRYKGAVPLGILIPHISCMFLTLFFSFFILLRIITKLKFKPYVYVAIILLFCGGIILGPIVQKYAFNEYWAGVPYGWDLTDNKTLIAFIFWIIAFFLNFKKRSNKISVIVAIVVTLVIFSIPHSMFGSQYNYETGKVVQGFIQNFLF